MQIENALTAHPAVREAAAVAVPDAAYGEVVGAWVVREPHAGALSLSREDVRRAVSQGMNPQVRTSVLDPFPSPFLPFPLHFPFPISPCPRYRCRWRAGRRAHSVR